MERKALDGLKGGNGWLLKLRAAMPQLSLLLVYDIDDLRDQNQFCWAAERGKVLEVSGVVPERLPGLLPDNKTT